LAEPVTELYESSQILVSAKVLDLKIEIEKPLLVINTLVGI
jgi:hypothetical protein